MLVGLTYYDDDYACTKETQSKILRGRLEIRCDIEKHSLNIFIGVLKFKVLEGILLIKKVVVRISSHHKYLGILVVNIKYLASFEMFIFSFSLLHFDVEGPNKSYDVLSIFQEIYAQYFVEILISIVTSKY